MSTGNPPGTLAAPTARIEIHTFDSLNLTEHQFLTASKDGKIAHIAGELRLPVGTERVPAVVLIHGSGGIGATVDLWAREMNSIGVAAFAVDCFTGRGITQTITDQSQLTAFSMIVDAYRALDLLAKHPRIDPARIGVMGFSKGGFAALYSSMQRLQREYGTPNLQYSAHIAFYPRCDTRFIGDEDLTHHPVRIFHGTADDYVPAAPAREYAERLRRAGRDVQITLFDGARHSFDNPLNPQVLQLPDAMVPDGCRYEERPAGVIVNLETGKPFDLSAARVRRGASVGYHPRARADAVKAVKEFFTRTWILAHEPGGEK